MENIENIIIHQRNTEMQVPAQMAQGSKDDLAACLSVMLSSAFTFYLKAHGFHWNVKGQDFREFHDLFGDIAADVYGSIDDNAENILVLGYDAPASLSLFLSMTVVADGDIVNSDPMSMSKALLKANEDMIAQIHKAFKCATAADEQGIIDFLAQRDSMHKKWAWQLRAITGIQSQGAASPARAEVVIAVESADGACPYCSVVCECVVGACMCSASCTCGCRAYSDDLAPMYSSADEPVIIAEERELAEALIEITKKHGKFNSDDSGVWAGYESADENELADKGVKCANCILYEGGTSCKIIATEVEPGGYCRFALIPDGVVTASGGSPCWDGYKQVGMKKGKNGNMVPNCVPIDTSIADEMHAELAASKPAPKKDRIKGSDKNKPGSAAGGKKIVFSDKVETALKNKVKDHNEKATAGRQVTLGMLKAVYRRGAGAFSSSHRPGMTRDQWAMARVNAYLRLVTSGRPTNSNYKQDNDLLPEKHPKASNSSEAITASALADSELVITLKNEEEYDTSENAVFAMAEYSGLGYEVIPAFRAAWVRAVKNDENPFERAKNLATHLYNSNDADLLPLKKEEMQ